MVSSGNVEKRREWQARFAKYRSSGVSVAQFCERERVSVHSFYYWANRLKAPATGSQLGHAAARSADTNAQATTVRFRSKTGTEVSVPADCLEAIRCLAECLMPPGDRCGEGFQEVVVKV